MKAIDVLRKISELEDIELFIVGGTVRDEIMGLPSNDIDIASKLTPEEMKKIAEKYNISTYDSGLKHGTITLLINDENIEHTTFRKDVSTDGRNATVEFTEFFDEDAFRRDFTLNGMYKNISTSQILDIVNGQEDINNKVIRFIGNANNRIKEDSLRIIRAYRFAIRFGFRIADSSLDAIKNNIDLLANISVERVVMEIQKMTKRKIDLDLFLEFIKIVSKSKKVREKHYILDVLCSMWECRFLNPCHKRYDVLSHSIDVVNEIVINRDDLGFVALFHDIQKIITKSYNKKRNKHSFIGHDRINHDFMKEFKVRTKISNTLFKKLCFFIKIHMHIKSLKKDRSIAKFILKNIKKKEDFDMFNELVILSIFDDTSRTNDDIEKKKCFSKNWGIILRIITMNELIKELKKEINVSDFKDILSKNVKLIKRVQERAILEYIMTGDKRKIEKKALREMANDELRSSRS